MEEKLEFPSRAGRPKGQMNKTTGQVKRVIANIIEDNLPRIQEDLDKLEAKDRLNVLLRLLEFVVPKRTPDVEGTTVEVTALQINLNGKDIRPL